MPSDRIQKIERSVDSLQRLFAVVVAFAITTAANVILFEKSNNLRDLDQLWNFIRDHFPEIIAFMSTIVPFFHGMNRHLDRTYIENAILPAKEGFLVMDFFAFFIESCFLVALASQIGAGNNIFLVLAVLLGGDIAWALISHGIHYTRVNSETLKWGIINIVACLTLLVIYYCEVFHSGPVRAWILAAVPIVRTIFDYAMCWNFYFPKE